MEKCYSIIEAFESTVATLLMHKKEFLKLIVIDLLGVLAVAYISMSHTASTMKLVFVSGIIYFLSFILVLAYIALFLKAFKREKVSFVEALNKLATIKVVKGLLVFGLMFMGVLVVSIFLLISMQLLVNVFFGAYAVTIVQILTIACLLPGLYYGGRYAMFAMVSLINGRSALEAVKESYKLTFLKLSLIVLGFSLVCSGVMILIIGICAVVSIDSIILISPVLMVLSKPLMHGTMTHLYLQLKKQ